MIDDYHKHEALDRTLIIINMIDELLLGHSYFLERPELRDKAGTALETLMEVYQAIAKEHLDGHQS
jgi:hypothetical protein